jgi:hypothetical protein
MNFLPQPAPNSQVDPGEETPVPKPPKSTPHSDLDGVREDERGNVDNAVEAGQDSADLKRAGDESAGRPDYAEDRPNRDDRSR